MDDLIGAIIGKEKREKLPSVHIHLAQAIPKGPKFDLIIQKSTEIGVNAITPVMSDLSVVRIVKGKAEEKLGRWRRIALEAAQQSNRSDVPDIFPPVTLQEFLSSPIKGDLNLLLWEGEKGEGEKGRSIRKALKDIKEVRSAVILVGPEGGFSDKEVAATVAGGFVPVSLGELILRTETAPLVILSILQYEFGYMG